MIALVQKFAGSTVVGSVATSAFPGNVVKGDLLLLINVYANSVVLNSVTDSRGNVWTIAGTADSADGSGTHASLAWAYAKDSGPCVVSMNYSGGPGFDVAVIVEYSGVTGNPTASVVQRSFVQPIPSGPLAGITANGLVFAGCIIYTSATVFTPSAGFTVQGTDNNVYGIADSYTQPAGTSSPTWTLSVNQHAFGFGFAFKADLPLQVLQPAVAQIGLRGYTIEPIEEE